MTTPTLLGRPVCAVVVLLTAACGAAGASSADLPASTATVAPVTPSTLPLYVPPVAPVAGAGESTGEQPPLVTVAVDEPAMLPVTVASADGTEVTIADRSRILPLWSNLSEIVFGLGLGEHVVGRDASATFAEAAHLPLVTRGHDVSAESVLSLRPTVVLAQTDTGPAEALDQIRAAGVPVLVLDTPTSVSDATARISAVATALGVPRAGAELATRTDAAIEAVLADVPHDRAPVRVAFLYLRGSAGVYLLGGPGSGADSMLAAAGAVDAGTWMGLERAFTPLTSEALAAAAPDAILMTTTGLESIGGIDQLVQIPGVAQTPAGEHRRVITVEDSLLYSFGARTPQAIADIVRQLYPE